MDAAIADTINRRDVKLMTARLDAVDLLGLGEIHWHWQPFADTMLSEDPAKRPDQAWIVGAAANGIPCVHFDGAPADCDWENLFSHFRAEILARRDPDSSPAHVAETPARSMV